VLGSSLKTYEDSGSTQILFQGSKKTRSEAKENKLTGLRQREPEKLVNIIQRSLYSRRWKDGVKV
jgi:hypothetical protein